MIDEYTASRLDHYVTLNESGCWIWTGAKSGNGYGYLQVNGSPKRAHRLQYERVYGEIPGKMKVLHRCDTPLCINPEHLFLGTDKENTLDAIKKKRKRWNHLVNYGRHPDAWVDPDLGTEENWHEIEVCE